MKVSSAPIMGWGNLLFPEGIRKAATSAEDIELTLKGLKDSVHLGIKPQKQCFLSEEEGLKKEGRWFFQSFYYFSFSVAYNLRLLNVYPVPGGMIDSWQTNLFQWNFIATL